MAEETITAQTPEIDPGMSVMPEGPGLMDVPTVIPELGLAAQALASQVSFAKKTWKDGSGGGTPITAAELNRLEQGVADLTAAVNGLRDSVSQLPAKRWQDKECAGDDFDNLREFFGAIYQRTPWTSEQHGPVGLNEYGFLFAFMSPTTGCLIQIYFSNYGQAAYRTKYTGSGWKDWKKIV